MGGRAWRAISGARCSANSDAGAAGFFFEGGVEGQEHGVFAQGECEVEHVVGGAGFLGAAEGEGVAVDFAVKVRKYRPIRGVYLTLGRRDQDLYR